MRFGPVAPIRHGMAHGVEEVIRAAVAHELEAFLEISRELLVVRERAEVPLEALGTLEIEQRPRVVHDRGDLGSAADDALVLRDRVDLAIAHPRDPLDLEPAERRLDPRPLRVDHSPADPRLEDAPGELLKVIVETLGLDLRGPFHRRATLRRVELRRFSCAGPRASPDRCATVT